LVREAEEPGGRYASDLWSTTDGVAWQRESDRFEWPGRHACGVVVFRDQVWIAGGTSSPTGESSRNDVWTFESA